MANGLLIAYPQEFKDFGSFKESLIELGEFDFYGSLLSNSRIKLKGKSLDASLAIITSEGNDGRLFSEYNVSVKYYKLPIQISGDIILD